MLCFGREVLPGPEEHSSQLNNNNETGSLTIIYWEEKSKLNPVSNLLSWRLPGGKNLGAAWVVVWSLGWKVCWTGAGLGWAGLAGALNPAW